MLLRDKDRTRLLDIFASVNTPMEVWAYGSRVTGGAHEGSDLDLVIRNPNNQKTAPTFFPNLERKFAKATFPFW